MLLYKVQHVQALQCGQSHVGMIPGVMRLGGGAVYVVCTALLCMMASLLQPCMHFATTPPAYRTKGRGGTMLLLEGASMIVQQTFWL